MLTNTTRLCGFDNTSLLRPFLATAVRYFSGVCSALPSKHHVTYWRADDVEPLTTVHVHSFSMIATLQTRASDLLQSREGLGAETNEKSSFASGMTAENYPISLGVGEVVLLPVT